MPKVGTQQIKQRRQKYKKAGSKTETGQKTLHTREQDEVAQRGENKKAIHCTGRGEG